MTSAGHANSSLGIFQSNIPFTSSPEGLDRRRVIESDAGQAISRS